MGLRRVQATDFRCLHSASLELDPHFTLITGPNASGKTSLLEALYILGRGRSFRTRLLEHLIRRGSDRFVVFGELELPERRLGMGIEGSASGVRAQIGGAKPHSLAELALWLPIQIIDPEVHRLIEEGPSRRRKFLDWGVFHVEPSFVGHWQRYQLVLKQRNAALRQRQSRNAVSAWDGELIRFGELLTSARRRYVELLSPHVARIAKRLLGVEVELSYRSGWLKELSLEAALVRSLDHEMDTGVTQVGPHRAELAIRVNHVAAKDHVSRGQQKLIAAALLLSQLKVFPTSAAIQPTLLLDDPAAELDALRLTGLIGEVVGHSLQLVVTTLQEEFTAFGRPGRCYRIADGKIDA